MKKKSTKRRIKKRGARSRRKDWPLGKPRTAERHSVKRIHGHVASVQLKKVFCQTCKSCKGHGPYRYLVYRKGSKVIWKYLGKKDSRNSKSRKSKSEA